MKTLVKRIAFNPGSLAKAFVDVNCAPKAFSDMLDHGSTAALETFADVLVAGDGPPAPGTAPLLLWGKEDQSPSTSEKHARELHAKLEGSTLRFVPNAGHFPQLEAPEDFVTQVMDWLAR